MAMEQFKKWLDKECDNGRTMYPSSYDDCSDAWRAALKWVKIKRFEESNPEKPYPHYLDEELKE